jgi:hypothetical protein
VTRDPSRVDYALVPDTDRPALGLRHDHAYWVSGLKVRDRSGDPGAHPARGLITARSLAFGEGDPTTRRVTGSGLLVPGSSDPALPNAHSDQGTEWTGIPAKDAENALELTFDNLGNAVVDGNRARLDGGQRLRVRLTSDGSSRLRLDLPLPAGAHVERVEGGPVPAAATRRRARAAAATPEVSLDSDGATFSMASGTRTYVIDSSTSSGAGPGDDEAPSRPTSSTASGDVTAGEGGSLPFTGLQLGLIFLAGALLTAGGTSLRRRFG